MPLQNYPPGELLPHSLTKEEIENPYQLLADFFDFAHLPDIRGMLWDMLITTASSNFHKLSRRDKANMMYFFARLRQMIEAIHLIHQLKRNETEARTRLMLLIK
jgi:hypothetical protein